MNLAQLREKVRLRMGVTQDDPLISAASIDSAVNDAVAGIAEERDWPWLLTSTTFVTVAGTGSYTPPVGWAKTFSLQTADSFLLEQVQIMEIEQAYADPSDRGVPCVYAEAGGELLLRPVPDNAYTVTHRYYRDEPTLTDNDSEPLLPDGLALAAVEGACALLFRRSGDMQSAEACRSEYERWLKRAYDKQLRTKGSMSVRVRPGALW